MSIRAGATTLYVFAPITNNGTINWLSGKFEYIYNNPGSYTGGINNMAGGAFNVDCDQLLDYNYGYEYFNNAGTFTKLLNTNTTTVAIVFTNSGSVVVQNGTISFSKMFSVGGSFQTATNAGIYGNLAGTFTGTLNWTGGQLPQATP